MSLKRYSIYWLIIISFIFVACQGKSSTLVPMENITAVSTNTSVIPKKITNTPFSTLLPSVQDSLFSILQNNGGCDLPCFLGITPGQTQWIEAKQILEMYSTNQPIRRDDTGSTEINTLYTISIATQMNETTPVQMAMYMSVNTDQHDIVKNIVFTSEIHESSGFPAYNDKHLLKYSLIDVYRRIGLPDEIYFDIGPTRGYSLYAVYEKLKIVLIFPGRAEDGENNAHKICPNIGDNQISDLRIALASPSDSIDIKTLIGYPFWVNTPQFEEVTGMSIKDFYNLLIGDQQPACFEVQQPK
ncbi:MAG: hypothetical protein LC108_11565 [Anaerolineales bacterium]|nr:hypothetical protein [Anaerolineales bacterium]